MPDPIEVLKALEVLVDQYGEDIDNYVNFDKLMESESVVAFVRPIIEERISITYLPGFTFEDNVHAAWFMKNHASWPTWVSNYPIKPEHWDETWTRMLIVPNKYHYVAEIAAAMQRYDQNTERVIREYNEIVKGADEQQIRRATKIVNITRATRGLPPGPVKGERNRMAMLSWRQRFIERFGGHKLPSCNESIFRLTQDADKYRNQRETGSPRNGWRISQVTYLGDIPNPDAEDQEAWERFTEGYFEVWEWHPVDKAEPPEQSRLTFREPAPPTLWARKWKKNKKRFRD